MRIFLHGCLAVLLLSTTLRAGPFQPVRIAVIGDRTGSEQSGIYKNIVAEVARLAPDLVLTVGDQIEGPVDDSLNIKQQWREYWDMMKPLAAPIHLTAGNNDIFDDRSQALFRRLVAPPYRSFDYRGIHVVILDNSRWERPQDLPKAQMDWLSKDLQKSARSRYTLVFIHKPFWASTLAEGRPDTLHSLFRKYDVDAVFSGHFHSYFSAAFDGIRYTAVGSSGGGAEPGPTGLQYHYTWVVLGDSGIAISPMPMGSLRAWDDVTLADTRAIEALNRSVLVFERQIAFDDRTALADSVLRVRLANPDDSLMFDDSLRWAAPPGWQVEPRLLPVRVQPHDSITAVFSLRHQGPVYPAPELSLRVRYAPGKFYTVKRGLPVCQTASCWPAAKPPIIDGQPTERCWQRPVYSLSPAYGGPSAMESTAVYFSYDSANLYLAVVCQETRLQDLAAKVTVRDGPVYAEDCIGFFLCPDTAQQAIYQIYFNPLGTIFDQKVTVKPNGNLDGDVAWNCDCTVRTAQEKDSWRIEAALPLAQFGSQLQTGDIWKANLRRKQKSRRAVADWQVPLEYDHGTYGRLVMR